LAPWLIHPDFRRQDIEQLRLGGSQQIDEQGEHVLVLLFGGA
jgi:hypothetical protein